MSSEYVPCRSLDGDERRWYAFLIVSVSTPFIIAGPVILWRIYAYFTKGTIKISSTASAPPLVSWETRTSFAASRFASDQTGTGQLLKFLAAIFAIGSLIIYFRDTAPLCMDVEMCHQWHTDPWWNVDLAFNCYFLFYYILRFMASQNKLLFIFEMSSLVDYFTVPPTFVAIGLDRNWHGLRYLRIVNLLWLVELLHRFRILRSVALVQLSRLIVFILIAIIVGAGTFLLLECSGDPWDIDNTLQQNGTFWNYAYFSVVTISTVGYGDIGCKTVLGKMFCCIYIFACLFFIASFIAAAASLFPPIRKYPSFDHSQYFNHVLVTGNITHTVAARFLEEFFEDAKPKGIDDSLLIFLHTADPDEPMILLLQDYQARVEYIRGTALDDEDLKKCRASYASLCIILADQQAADPDQEDATHILEIVAIKNYCPTLRVQIQVLKPSTTLFLKNYPSVDTNGGDTILCQKNIELALIGMNCLVPGFATMFCDLILAPKLSTSDPSKIPELYARGRQMHLTCVRFSPAFYGLSVPDAVQICFEKLNILLVAVYTRGKSEMDYHNVIPNPTSAIIITENLRGQVIARSTQHAKALEIFCQSCHADAKQPDVIGPCHCHPKGGADIVTTNLDQVSTKLKASIGAKIDKLPLQEKTALMSYTSSPLDGGQAEDVDVRQPNNRLDTIKSEQTKEKEAQFDLTGMFYWQPAQDFDACLLTAEEATNRQFNNHIVVFILSLEDSPLIGLHNLIQPLRASSITFEEMHEVVLVGDLEKIRQEWMTINMLPKIWVVGGNPAVPSVMRSAQLQNCYTACLISSPQATSNGNETLADKDVIIMTLRLRGLAYNPSQIPSPRPFFVRGVDLQVLSYLDNEKSARFLSQESSSTDYRYTVPYMSGQVLASTSLESLLITACYNPSLIRLCSSLVFGGISSELTRVASEGMGLQGPMQEGKRIGSQLKTTIKIVDLDSDLFRTFIDKPYADLFLFALREMGIICVGLYRLFEQPAADSQSVWKWGRDTRYVATNPPADVILDASDRVYVLLPAEVL